MLFFNAVKCCANKIFFKERSFKIKKKPLIKIGVLSIFFHLISANYLVAQNVTIKQKNVPIMTVLNKIKQQTGYDIFYKTELINKALPVTINVSNYPLKDALNLLFSEQPIGYSITNKTIVIREKDKSASPQNTLNTINVISQDSIIRGIVKDSAGHILQGVSVSNITRDGRVYTFGKSDGTFEIQGQLNDLIKFSVIGYKPLTVEYKGQKLLKVILKENIMELNGVKVETFVQPPKKDPTVSIDMSNRQYMNLGEILQGTVPGLSLQYNSSSKTQVTSIDVFQHLTSSGETLLNYQSMTYDEFLAYKGQTEGQAIIDALLKNPYAYGGNNNTQVLYRLHTTTSVTNTLVPQIRGINSYTGTSSMLVVIDGFPQDEFPASYPMANVESIEVVKDPQELIKWGAKAAGGLILIKTKSGKKGSMLFNYMSSFYYTPAPKFNFKKLQLSETSDYLDYSEDYLDSTGNTFVPTSFNLTPAQRLLAEKRERNLLIDPDFNKSWDSLKSLNNESQLALLQQNAFNQTHSLSVAGGSKQYRFTIIGNYTSNSGNELKSSSTASDINMNNHLNLLNDRLHIDWLLKYTHTQNRIGYSFNPNNTLEPYQLLLDGNGNYIYDYYNLSPSANATIESYGYKNYGSNVLEDARLNKNSSIQNLLQNRYNMDWSLSKNLRWTTSIFYRKASTNTESFYDKESSYVRQLVDQYGEIEKNGVNFYIPYGNIMKKNTLKDEDWNVRSGLSYKTSFGKHNVSATIGYGAASSHYSQPDVSTMFGYNTKTKSGVPIYLPAPDPEGTISNFYSLFSTSSTVTPYTYAVASGGYTTNSRNINWNGSIAYDYNSNVFLNGSYNSVFNPLYGQSSKYSVLSNYNIEATGIVLKKSNPKKAFSKLLISAGLTGMIMPDLPVSYSNTRLLQTDWGNYSIWVNGLSPTQQKGQRTLNYFERMTLNMFDDRFVVNVAYNQQKITTASNSSTNEESSADSSYTEKYMSAGLRAKFRKGAFLMDINYSKSPEGSSQVNGAISYDIAHESYFHSKKISTLIFDGKIESISPYQGLGLMMGTNVSSGGSYSSATNNSFNTLPPKNTNWEMHFEMGINKDDQMFDLRYYNHTTSGLNNYTNVYTDPSTGLSSQTTYSSINNKGIEFYFKNKIINHKNINYTITLNGAYNVNIARSVPKTAFSASSSYATAYRDGYNTSNIWSFKWAGLDNKGDPQVYDINGNKTASMDSTTLSTAMVYSGTTIAPWTGGFIHELTYKQFFTRVALTFQWGYVMRRYIPAMNSELERSVLVKDRWRQSGDENHTDIARIKKIVPGETDADAYRAFVLQNSSNSILSANNIRLQEIMFGWSPPIKNLKKFGLMSFTLTIQAQNVAIWTKNKYHIDPSTVGTNGRIGLAIPRQYSCTINVGF
ncbi:MAG: secretin and TonB N-terminal domain-containing protein [Arachidicoccus sp.]|nr:secretin and TonB N-terminal domain-containing protein [Arachidicoccus sp.]